MQWTGIVLTMQCSIKDDVSLFVNVSCCSYMHPCLFPRIHATSHQSSPPPLSVSSFWFSIGYLLHSPSPPPSIAPSAPQGLQWSMSCPLGNVVVLRGYVCMYVCMYVCISKDCAIQFYACVCISATLAQYNPMLAYVCPSRLCNYCTI